MHDLPLMDEFVATAQRTLWHPTTKTLVLADLHLGFEQAMILRGHVMPLFAAEPMRAQWDQLMTRRPKQIVVAGDLFHTANPPQEIWQAALALLQAVPPHCKVTVIPGNHDPALAALETAFSGTPIAVAEAVSLDAWRIVHGHQIAPAPSGQRGLIVGHQHPAIIFANRFESAKMPCFAASGGAHPLIVLPAFSPAPLGSNLLAAGHWIIDAPMPPPAAIRIAGIVQDRVLDFGRLDRL